MDVWGIGGRCAGAPGGVEEEEEEEARVGWGGLGECWRRPVSGWERGSLGRVWEDMGARGSMEGEEIGSADVDRSLSEDLELWC